VSVNSRPILISGAAVALLALVSVIAYGFLAVPKTNTLTDADLIARINEPDPDRQMEIIRELSRRGHDVIPAIMEAFEKADSPEVRMCLAQTIYRMPPSSKTVSALRQMSQSAKNKDLEGQVERFARDHSLSVDRAGGRRR